MKLSRLYSNFPEAFAPIEFRPGLNVVIAEIRLPENKRKDTHNLGKTTLGKIIDFCLISKRDPKFFLLKHANIFGEFVFFLELELLTGSFLTLRRSVGEPTKISFKFHSRPLQDFVELPDVSWDHIAVAYERAKELLDGILDLRDLKPWGYRKSIGYLLRSQDDFRDVFQLKKFSGPHVDWKPFLSQILGFDASVISLHYAKEIELEQRKAEEEITKSELGGTVGDVSKIEGLLLLKQQEVEKKQSVLDTFDFRQIDKEKTKMIVDGLDASIAHLNAERYSLAMNRKKIQSSIEDDEILFDPKSAAEIFAEAGILFAGQIRKDFQQLIDFNKAITEERRGYLREEMVEVEASLARVNAELRGLGRQRSEALSFVTGADVFVKYKQAMDEMVTLRTDIASLERQRIFLRRLQELRASIRSLNEELGHLQAAIELDVERCNGDKTSMFSAIRLFFNEVVESVISRKALLSVAPNQMGHLEFTAEILDDSGCATSADRGFTYRKLLCVAFDLALARAHLGGRYPRFVFHDGVFESLDDRKKMNLIDVIRSYAELGIQHVVTLIDSDLPSVSGGEKAVFGEDAVILRLHDEGDGGRLFRMPAW